MRSCLLHIQPSDLRLPMRCPEEGDASGAGIDDLGSCVRTGSCSATLLSEALSHTTGRVLQQCIRKLRRIGRFQAIAGLYSQASQCTMLRAQPSPGLQSCRCDVKLYFKNVSMYSVRHGRGATRVRCLDDKDSSPSQGAGMADLSPGVLLVLGDEEYLKLALYVHR